MDTIDLPPLPLERLAQIWWEAGDQFLDGWKLVAHWTHGAYAVATSREDRENWHLLGLIAWDHAGVRRLALSEVAA